ncbi:MAG: L-glutamate gamma-semialdehyde dehydrogenase [Gemmatimonadetes bacterium]|nr:MAG: L-glutamate gamma-semialdehyde dehydrogenase [Gemmatimonadota bacterium]
MLREFRNEPYVDFSQPEPRRRMEEALAYVESQLGKEYSLIIGNEHITTDAKITSIAPSDKNKVIGIFSKADKELANKAVETAYETFQTWKNVDPIVRARYLLKGAAEMRRRIYEFSAWMVYEEGKNWLEAYADTAEAIDFLEFYAREMMRLAAPQPLTPIETEENDLQYIPLGVFAVIPPWNFPLAIMAGMTTAAVVSGNTVVLKPASTAPAVARVFVDMMINDCSLPPGVINFCPGSGGEMGDTIVAHPKTRGIAFTGSKEVGLHIHELAAKTQPGQIWIKRTILEMGGKDAILVDNNVDTDEAAAGIVASAFGFQGQKCSACSRAIVHQDVYDEVLEKVVAKAKELTVGHAKDNPNMAAVIDENAYNNILNYIEIGKGEGRLMCGGEPAKVEGYDGFYIQPTVIADVDPQATIAQEEIFGPVLAFIKANDFKHGLEIVNNTEFGLTGAVYSKNREHLELARREFHVGNLYFNRKCTGALVGSQPFGGFNMSGTDSKAGGRDYLLLFTQAKLISERL